MVTVDILLLGVIGFLVAYLLLLSILALFVRKEENFRSEHLRRFAVIVPAHDEEFVIEKTIRSLLAVDYPRNRFDLIVVADNCTDKTALVARASGAIVLERSNTALRGKGYALRWCFDKLLNTDTSYEAFVVVDADSVVTSNTLRVLNYYLERGAHAIQVADIVLPKPDSWNSEVIRLAFTLYNVVRPLGRKALGCSAGLRGNGMCFTRRVLRNVSWQAYSLTEDLEYGLQLLLHGYTVTFAPEAEVIATMPEHSKHSETQRTRWETGRFPVIRKYATTLLVGSFEKHSFALFDALVDLVTPPFVNLMSAVFLIILGHLLTFIVAFDTMYALFWLWVAVFVAGVLHVLVGLLSAKADRLLVKALLHVPVYAFWKFSLYLKLFLHGGTVDWIRTTRERFAGRSGK